MSVPMIGPGPLEGGPKGSPGPAKNADEFSACLKEECGREAVPTGDPLPPEKVVSAKSVLPAEPEQLLQPTSTSSPEQSVDTTPAVAPSVLELLAVGLDPTIPIQLDTNTPPALEVISAGAVEPFVDGDLPQLTVEDSTEKEESDTDTPSPLKELAASFPAVPVSSPVPLVVAAVPLAVVVPDTGRSFSNEGLKVEAGENPGVVEAVSGPGRVLNTDFVTPVVDNSKSGRGPLPSLEADRVLTPPPADQTSGPSIPREENDHLDGTQRMPESSRMSLTNPSRVEGDFDKQEMVNPQKQEVQIQQTAAPMAGAQLPMPAAERPVSSNEQDATFREALKAVLDATGSLKGPGGLVLSGDGPALAPIIDKGTNVESVRPAVPVPVLSPSPVELAKQIHVHLESGRSVVHVELHPDHLGEMNIALEAKGKDVSMRFTVDNDTARHSVVAGLKELSGSLNTLGWTVNGLAVQVASGGVGNGRSDADGSRWAAFPVNANQVPVEQKTDSRSSPSGAWRVDLVA